MEEKDMKCTTRSSEYLIRRPWMTVRKDVVVHPDGRVQPEYYVLEYPDFINVIAITTDGRIIMEQQWRQAVGEVSLEIPAGVVEKGETPKRRDSRAAHGSNCSSPRLTAVRRRITAIRSWLVALSRPLRSTSMPQRISATSLSQQMSSSPFSKRARSIRP